MTPPTTSPLSKPSGLLPARVEGHQHARTHLHDLIYVILPLWPNRVDFISLHNGRCFTIKKHEDFYQLYEQIQHPRVEYWRPEDEVLLWEGNHKRTIRALMYWEVTKGKRL